MINPDGKVTPCCWITNEKNVFGDLLKDSFEDIWNNTKYVYSRGLFFNNKVDPSQVKTACSTCNIYNKKN